MKALSSYKLVLPVVTVTTLSLLSLAPPASAAAPVISFDDPAASGPLHAGPVDLRGSFNGASGGETTTVLYLVDVSGSTINPRNLDCDGNGAVDAHDDINGDTVIGDILDCEIRGVTALNDSLSGLTASTVQVGVQIFAGEAATADMSSTPGSTFVAPTAVAEDGTGAVLTVANSVRRQGIRKFTPKAVPNGTNFDAAVTAALGSLSKAPTGPKWVFLLSDGGNPSDPRTVAASAETLSRLSSSGVHLRSFAVGSQSSCTATFPLARLAAATGERCVQVTSPANLAAQLTGSQTDTVSTVEVSISGVTLVADVDPIGTWRARVQLGEGAYTATATALLKSGQRVSASRSFSVLASAPATTAPAPGVVTPASNTLLATRLSVRRPRPSRAALPSSVTGTVRVPGSRVGATPALTGAVVVLQGRKASTRTWVRVASTTVGSGRYTLRWKRAGINRLRVVLRAHAGFAGGRKVVPLAAIRACTVSRNGSRWTIRCRTTARTGTTARLLHHGKVVDRDRITRHRLVLSGRGKIRHGNVIRVRMSSTSIAQLRL